MKMRGHRLERVARWGCTVLAAFTLAAWAYTWSRDLCLKTPGIADERWAVAWLSRGNLSVMISRNKADAVALRSLPKNVAVLIGQRGSMDAPATWAPRFKFSPGLIELVLQLPLLLLVSSTTGAWLWRCHSIRARLARTGEICHSCGYSRAGLAPDAPCPECGSLRTPEGAG